MSTSKCTVFKTQFQVALCLFCLLGLAAVPPAPAATQVWFGPATTSLLNIWSIGGANWNPAGTAGSSDDCKFYDLGNIPGVSNINNTVDAAFGGTIASLQYGNTNGFHTTLITNGVTLNITGAGGLTVGSLGDPVPVQIANVTTITGSGGVLNVN